MLSLFDDWPKDAEEQFWQAYPRKVSKGAMKKSFARVREQANVKFDAIMAGLERYKAWLSQRSRTCWRPEPKHPSTWLNQECWNDEFGGDYETTRGISAAAQGLVDQGFQLGPRPRNPLFESSEGDVRLLAKE